MFNKGNKDLSLPEPTASAGAPAKRSAMKSKAPSILSGDLVLTGSIVSEGEVQLDGTIEGDVRAGSLIIGEEAHVKGEVVADNVVVRGRVNGSLRARQVQLASTARIEGDIVHASLSVESGAFFDGHCRHSQDPTSERSGPANDSKTDRGSTMTSGSSSKSSGATPPPTMPKTGSSLSSLDAAVGGKSGS